MKIFVLLLFMFTTAAVGERKLICADNSLNKILILEGGKIVWEYQTKGKPIDISALENGNILYCTRDGYVIEVNQNKETVWEFNGNTDLPEKKSSKVEFQSCQRLSDGTTLIGANSEYALFIVSKEKKIIKKIDIVERKSKPHRLMRRARKCEDGLIYVGQTSGVVVYHEDKGKIKSIPKKSKCHMAELLPDGNILATGKESIFIYSQSGKVIWSATLKDFEEEGFYGFNGFKQLSNGNFLLCNSLGHGKVGTGNPMIEINREKKVLWRYDDRKSTKTIVAVDLLK